MIEACVTNIYCFIRNCGVRCSTDVLRECRSDNTRLIDYLSRPEIVMDLVRTTFDLPPLVGPARPDATGSQKSATSTETPQPVSHREQQKEHHLKHAHVASEILTSDNQRLSEAIVCDDKVMDKVFSYLELAEPGQLHSVVAAYFSRLMLSLLKTRNAHTTAQMAKRDHFFIATLLKHIDCPHIADLVVHILDSPESEVSYHAPPTNKRPTQEALDLLAKADIFGGLADCYFRASTDVIEASLASSPMFSGEQNNTNKISKAELASPPDPRLGKHALEANVSERPTQKPRSTPDGKNSMGSNLSPTEGPASISSSTGGSCPTEDSTIASRGHGDDSSTEGNAVVTDSASSNECSQVKDNTKSNESETSDNAADEIQSSHGRLSHAEEERLARRRRLREETMANITSTMFGLTERMLQLPELGIPIPDRLSVFSTPGVVSRLIDAGIYAKCSGSFSCNNEALASACGHLRPSGNYSDAEQSNEHRVEAFSTGCNSALMHALGLVASLLTSEANVFHVDDDSHEMDTVSSGTSGVGAGRIGSGRGSIYSGKGISESLIGVSGSKDEKAGSGDNGTIQVDATMAAKLLAGKKEGDKIVDTSKLERELCVRFHRLANMLQDYSTEQKSSKSMSASTSTSGMRPLGSLRLKLAEFFVACIKYGNEETVHRIMALGVPRMLLELFEKYSWSSMLHSVITSAVISCLSGGDLRKSGRHAWLKAGLIEWLIEVWSRSGTNDGTTPRWGRCGYMGHLISIGKAIREFLSTYDISEGVASADEVQRFREFVDSELTPAYDREATPLCAEGCGNGADPDDAEEATDVLDMGGIQFVEGLGSGSDADIHMMKYAVMNADADIEDEGEIEPVVTAFDEDIKTVDVDDLGHFGGDDDDDEELTSISKTSESGPVQSNRQEGSNVGKGHPQVNQRGDVNTPGYRSGEVGDMNKSVAKDNVDSDRKRGSGRSGQESGSSEGVVRGSGPGVVLPQSSGGSVDTKPNLKNVDSGSNSAVNVCNQDIADAVVDTVDSSSDEEGSYEAFVDVRKDDGLNCERNSSKKANSHESNMLASQVQRLKVNDEVGASSLAGAVTEIDEDGDSGAAASSVNEGDENLGRLAANMMRYAGTQGDDDENSSDDEYESWEDASRELEERQEASNQKARSAAGVTQQSVPHSEAQSATETNTRNVV